MKLSTSQVTAILLLGLTPAVTANSCVLHAAPGANAYDLWAENVYGIKGICGGLWDNLKRFAVTCSPVDIYCGGIENTHILNWKFRVPPGCNKGMIESAWWEATKNQFGSIQCRG